MPDTSTSSTPDARARILESAIALLGRRGYDSVSVADIASESGVSTALIYYHFADKESLLRSIIERATEAFDANARVALDAPGSAAERIERFTAVRIRDVSANASLVRILVRPITDPEGPLAAELLEAISGTIGAIAAVIEEGIGAGEFEAVDPWVAAECLFALINTRVAAGVLEVPYAERLDYGDEREHAAFVSRLFLRGIAR